MNALEVTRAIARWIDRRCGGKIAARIVCKKAIDPTLTIEAQDILRAFDQSVAYFFVTENGAPDLSFEQATDIDLVAQRLFEAAVWVCEANAQPLPVFFRGVFCVFIDRLIIPRYRAQEEMEQDIRTRRNIELFLRQELARTEKKLQDALSAVLEMKKELDEAKRIAQPLELPMVQSLEFKVNVSIPTGKPN